MSDRPTVGEVTPFTLAVPQAELDDLAGRLARTRWPERETAAGQGVPLDAARRLVEHWRTRYDWRRCEAMLNGLGQYRTTIDGLGIHFLHVRSPEPDALPMVMTHGWPGSVIEFHKVIGPLTDPRAHGGDARDAFHLVLPSLPGYGFSDRPAEAGWGTTRIAGAWIALMRALGYDRFVAQGGDWGAAVTNAIGASGAAEVAGIHLNMVVVQPTPDEIAQADEEERAIVADRDRFRRDGQGYAQLQSTRPQTIGYALTDSPVGQATWIYEKLAEWSDCGGDPTTVLSLDEMIDDIMLYWLPASAASSARLYRESFRTFDADPLTLPVACSIFPRELHRASRRWAERRYPNLIHFNRLPRGGHFAAFEQPALFVDELRAAFRSLR
jgi:pimeloyl-ACP methyl ester carboxylesterase